MVVMKGVAMDERRWRRAQGNERMRGDQQGRDQQGVSTPKRNTVAKKSELPSAASRAKSEAAVERRNAKALTYLVRRRRPKEGNKPSGSGSVVNHGRRCGPSDASELAEGDRGRSER